MSGLGDKLTGSAKEVAGKLTGNEELEAKGKVQQVTGNLKDRVEDMKDSVGEKVNEVLDKAKDSTDDESQSRNNSR